MSSRGLFGINLTEDIDEGLMIWPQPSGPHEWLIVFSYWHQRPTLEKYVHVKICKNTINVLQWHLFATRTSQKKNGGYPWDGGKTPKKSTPAGGYESTDRHL